MLENEYDRLDTMVRIMAPMMSAKIKNPTTSREARHKAVIEDQRGKRAKKDEATRKAVMETTLADLARMGFDVEVTGPFTAPDQRKKS